MDSEPADEEPDDAHLDDEEDAQPLTTYQRRLQHQLCLAEIFQMDSDELLKRLAIERYDQAGYIPAEVLVTLARSRYGAGARVRNAIALALNRQVIFELRYFLKINPEWYAVIARNSEQATEAVSEVQLRIFKSTVDISFAEVAFRPFVEKRLMDWCKSQARHRNAMPSADDLKAARDDDQPSIAEGLVDENAPALEDHVEREQQKKMFSRCWSAVRRLPEKQRTSLILYVLQDMTFKQAGEVMKLEESTVRKHVKSALEALRNGDWHE